MTGLVAPYNTLSDPIPRDGGSCYETINPGCFRDAIASGLTPSGKPIALVRGHRRNGRKRREWHICDTRSGLKLIDSPQGLLIEAPGEIPGDFTGFSIKLVPYTWRRIGPNAFRLLSAGIRHIALLQSPERPAYSSTFTYVSNHAIRPIRAERRKDQRQKEEKEVLEGQTSKAQGRNI